jgi:hypothetical protein
MGLPRRTVRVCSWNLSAAEELGLGLAVATGDADRCSWIVESSGRLVYPTTVKPVKGLYAIGPRLADGYGPGGDTPLAGVKPG